MSDAIGNNSVKTVESIIEFFASKLNETGFVNKTYSTLY